MNRPARESTYDIALVLDDARRHFVEAAEFLDDVHSELRPKPLQALHLLFLQPTTLMCLFCFDSSMAGLDARTQLVPKGHSAGFRMLDLMHLTMHERQKFYADYFKRISWHELNVEDPRLAMQALRTLQRLSPAKPEALLVAPTPAVFIRGDTPVEGVARELSAEQIYVEADIVPDVGETFELFLRPRPGAAPLQLHAKVAYSLTEEFARTRHVGPGFGVEVGGSPQHLNLYESFLIAKSRGEPWPGASGRRFERFPIRLSVEFEHQDTACAVQSRNFSRGGLFVEAPTSLPLGTTLPVRVSKNAGLTTELLVEVVHCSPQADTPGMGLKFVEDHDVVHAKLRELLAATHSAVKGRALLVDDDRFFRTVIGTGLREAGFEVLEATNGEEAFRILIDELFRFDIVFLDYYMPGMTGLDLADKIQRIGGANMAAVVMLTGAELSAGERKMLEDNGIGDVIAKSLNPSSVVERAMRLLAQKRRQYS